MGCMNDQLKTGCMTLKYNQIVVYVGTLCRRQDMEYGDAFRLALKHDLTDNGGMSETTPAKRGLFHAQTNNQKFFNQVVVTAQRL